MLNQLSSLSFSLWIAAIVLQLSVCGQIVLGRLSRYPMFRAYVIWQTTASLSAFTVFCAGSGPGSDLYSWIYFTGSIFAELLLVCAAFEVYRYVFGPRIALPRGVPEKTAFMTILAFTAAVAFGVVTRAVAPLHWNHYLTTVENVLTVAGWLFLAILFIHSRSLAIAWPRRIAQIWIGFAVYLTVDIFAVFVRNLGGAELAYRAGVAGQFAYIVTLLWWCSCFWEKETVLPATPEQVKEVLAWHKETMRFLRHTPSAQD